MGTLIEGQQQHIPCMHMTLTHHHRCRSGIMLQGHYTLTKTALLSVLQLTLRDMQHLKRQQVRMQ